MPARGRVFSTPNKGVPDPAHPTQQCSVIGIELPAAIVAAINRKNRAATFYAQRDWGETPLNLKTRPRPAACEMPRCLAVLSVSNSGPGGYGVRVSQ